MSDLLVQSNDMWDLEPVLEVWIHQDARPATLRLAGRLDKATGAHVRDLLTRLSNEGHRDLMVDLTSVRVREKIALTYLCLPWERGHLSDQHVIFLDRVTHKGEEDSG
jgi:anti-anti-sigma regulatory factor